MKNKSTLVCIHVMPNEIEMFVRFMNTYKLCLKHLDENDDVTLKVSLNLNPELTDWEKSELTKEEFIDAFNECVKDVDKIHKEIVTNTSLWGTTQQKREAIKLNYDQFIFCDTDIILHQHQLKHQINASKQMDGMYILSPSLPKWWDESWDVLVSSSEKINGDYGDAFKEEYINKTKTQQYTDLSLRMVAPIKFGCGMHTLYSKEFWDLIGIPESFGGYGPEDTFGMFAAHNAIVTKKYPIKQFVLDGIYITEDYTNRTPSFDGKLVTINKKDEFYQNAKSNMDTEMKNFLERI
jgi:hypothetical protein